MKPTIPFPTIRRAFAKAVLYSLGAAPVVQQTARLRIDHHSNQALERRLRPVSDLTNNPRVRLAWAMLVANPRRLIFACAGVAISAALMQYQTALIYGFLRAASAPIRGLAADIWVIPHLQPAFEFPYPLSRGYERLISGRPGVQLVTPIANAFAAYKGPSGQLFSVTMVGVDLERFDANLGQSGRQQMNTKGMPSAVAFDVSDRRILDISDDDPSFEINGHAFIATDAVSGYATFLGPPYAFASFDSVRRALGLQPDQANSFAVYCATGADMASVVTDLKNTLPELTILTSSEFARSSSFFWLLRTGAGGGLILSAVLGFVVGFIIVSQTLFSATQEHLKEYTTLRAIGLGPGDLAGALLMQALMLAIPGALVGTAMAYGMTAGTKAFILGWIALPIGIPPPVVTISILMALLASVSSVRILLRIEPAVAFREG